MMLSMQSGAGEPPPEHCQQRPRSPQRGEQRGEVGLEVGQPGAEPVSADTVSG